MLTEDQLLVAHKKASEELGGQWDEGLFLDMQARYNEPHRAYHNLAHIESVWDRIRELVETPPPTLILAALYHDVVYIPGLMWNEELSGVVAESHMRRMDINEDLIEDTVIMILTTQKHEVYSTDPAPSVALIDADLYELGTDAYVENGENIEAEFLTRFSPEEYRMGRKQWIKTFLERDAIYLMPGQEELEAKARENLQTELDSLKE